MKHKRLKDPAAYYQAQKLHCEHCGWRAYGGAHHIVTRGAGGPDHSYNLIQLCADCHTKAHAGQIDKRDLWNIVARREGVEAQELIDAVNRLRGRDV